MSSESLKSRHPNGFTIVELLIVIVVIGILAAITIVAYNGIQQRGENTKTVAGVTQVIKLMKAYKSINNSYPTAGVTYNCLGTGYPSNICVTGASGNTIAANFSSFDTALATVGTQPTLSTKGLAISGSTYSGAFYQSGNQMVRYYLDGASQACSAGGTGANFGNVTECSLTLD